MSDARPYKISYDVLEGIGLVVTLEGVPSFGALFSYEPTDENLTIVIPSVTCPEEDLRHIKEFCKEFNYSYQPPPVAAVDSGKEGAGPTSKGNDDQSAKRDGEAGGESSGKQP